MTLLLVVVYQTQFGVFPALAVSFSLIFLLVFPHIYSSHITIHTLLPVVIVPPSNAILTQIGLAGSFGGALRNKVVSKRDKSISWPFLPCVYMYVIYYIIYIFIYYTRVGLIVLFICCRCCLI